MMFENIQLGTAVMKITPRIGEYVPFSKEYISFILYLIQISDVSFVDMKILF